MKDQTVIAIVGIFALLIFGVFLNMRGYDGYLAGSIIFVIASAMGIAIPRPGFLREE